MRIRLSIKYFLIVIFAFLINTSIYAESGNATDFSIDRIELVTKQIDLLKSRLAQFENELKTLQVQDQSISQITLDKAGKHFLDKALLDTSVGQSNIDNINIELSDSQQAASWLEKNVQEIENQLNVISIFRLKTSGGEAANIKEYNKDLHYQQKLLELEEKRVKYLQRLQTTANLLLSLKKERLNQINTLLKSRKMLHMKQQQVKDELAFQEQQNYWLQQVNLSYARLAKIDPSSDKNVYSTLEREIFYANEKANLSYIRALFARYTDQTDQIKLVLLRSNSITLLNEISNQTQSLNKQIIKLDGILKSRSAILDKHLSSLSAKKDEKDVLAYIKKLTQLNTEYSVIDKQINELTANLSAFRKSLDQALQNELSSRQGFPNFGTKMLIDLGKELLLVPPLTFQVLKSLSTFWLKAYKSTNAITWSLFILLEGGVFVTYLFLRRLLNHVLSLPTFSRDQIHTKLLSLEWLRRNLLDLILIGNILGLMFLMNVPMQSYNFIFYISIVWISVKSILTISRICLVETTHDTKGYDVKLYRRLKWIIMFGGLVTGLTVFVHQLPLIYELKTLFDHVFLFLLMIISLLLLRYWDVVPNLILSNTESKHPYLQKSIRLIGILVPVLLFGNSVVGLFGYVNLILTVSWYEGIFIIVLILYLTLRGLMSDGMEQLSRLLIQYINNGWLWTEAVLKPLDKVLRITLFLVAWAVLFLLYGWDKQSPIVERLTGMLHYQLASVLNTTITPLSIIELFVVISVFYWTAKWTREFVYRMLLSRTSDMGIRNSIAILSQYSVVLLGGFICLRLLGIDLRALAVVFSVFAFGIGWGLRDLANNFVCGFLILLERPLRVGDIVNINEIEGEVIHIGSRAVTVRTWDHMDLVVPNAEIFNKSFVNWTAKDNIVRTVIRIKISRYDNPHEIKVLIQNILALNENILKDPPPEVYLREMNDVLLEFELRYYVNIRQVHSRVSVTSSVLMTIWDLFEKNGIKPPYPQQEIFLRSDVESRVVPTKAIGRTE